MRVSIQRNAWVTERTNVSRHVAGDDGHSMTTETVRRTQVARARVVLSLWDGSRLVETISRVGEEGQGCEEVFEGLLAANPPFPADLARKAWADLLAEDARAASARAASDTRAARVQAAQAIWADALRDHPGARKARLRVGSRAFRGGQSWSVCDWLLRELGDPGGWPTPRVEGDLLWWEVPDAPGRLASARSALEAI